MRYGSAATTLRDPMLDLRSGRGPVPADAGLSRSKGARINIKINSLGFRGDEFTREKPANTVRIVCLGASTTFSAEVSSQPRDVAAPAAGETPGRPIPAMKIEVINAAVGGYVAADNLKNLRHRVLPLDPDLVIYYEANNEIVRDTQELAVREGLIRSRRRPVAARDALSNYSLMFDLVYKNLAILSQPRETSAAEESIACRRIFPQRFIGVLDEMRAELAAADIRSCCRRFS